VSPKSCALFAPGSEDAVIPFGEVPFSRLSLYLGACDAFVLPLRDNVFNRTRWPNKFGDYLAAGRPILCGNVGDVARIVKAEGCGLVWTDLPELMNCVEILISNREAAEAMGRAARGLAEGRLGWRSLALDFLGAYHHALAKT